MTTSLKSLAAQEGALTLTYQQQVEEAAHALKHAPREGERRELFRELERRLHRQAAVGRSVARKVLGTTTFTTTLPQDYYESRSGLLPASLCWLTGKHPTIEGFTHLMVSEAPAVTVRWWDQRKACSTTTVIPLEWLFMSDRAFAKVVRQELAHDREWRERNILLYHYKKRLAYLEGEVGYLRNLREKHGENPAPGLPARPMALR